MSQSSHAMKAYAVAAARDPREQEAEAFLYATGMLRRARAGDARVRGRALADNRRLWGAVIDLLHDPQNALPAELRAAIISVGLAVQREMQQEQPNFEFLIAVNENIAAGLARAG